MRNTTQFLTDSNKRMRFLIPLGFVCVFYAMIPLNINRFYDFLCLILWIQCFINFIEIDSSLLNKSTNRVCRNRSETIALQLFMNYFLISQIVFKGHLFTYNFLTATIPALFVTHKGCRFKSLPILIFQQKVYALILPATRYLYKNKIFQYKLTFLNH